MKTFIKNLCDKLESWGIDPNILAKAVCIFLTIIVLIGLMVIFPILLAIVIVIAICVVGVGLIYLMLE